MHEHEYARCKQCTTLLDNQHAHSRSVDHSSDAIIDCVPEPTGRALELKDVHSFTEYHESLKQDYGKIAKSYADFTIRHYGSTTTVVSDSYEEELRIREEDTIFIQLSASLQRQIYHARWKGSC